MLLRGSGQGEYAASLSLVESTATMSQGKRSLGAAS
jgi:hypothetical protein